MPKLSCGIVGLPNVGKSTLFNALLKRKQASASNYPFCTIDPNVGIVDVPDERLEVLAKISHSQKIIPATMTFIDIAGLVKGAAQGEGLGNQFLANIRETNAILHVVRCFEEEKVIHVEGQVNPLRDIEIINLELILSDLQMAENILQKLEKQAKGKKELSPSINLYKKIIEHLNQNQPLRTFPFSKEEQKEAQKSHFITQKPIIYVANISEKEIQKPENSYVQKVKEFAQKESGQVITISAKLEEELVNLSEKEAEEYLAALGLKEPGLNRLIKIGFQTLGLISFLTTGEKETRAWTITKGTTAQEAAGEIHGDIQKGFIRAEVIKYEDVVTYKGRVGAKEAGKARIEGRDYIIQDGDVILFYHN